MDAVIAFVGVGLGWLLAVGTQRWRERRDIQAAAVVILGELVANRAAIDTACKGETWAFPEFLVSRHAWDTQGVVLVRGLHPDVVWLVANAYVAVQTASGIIRTAIAAEERQRESEATASSEAVAKADSFFKAALHVHLEQLSWGMSALVEAAERASWRLGRVTPEDVFARGPVEYPKPKTPPSQFAGR